MHLLAGTFKNAANYYDSRDLLRQMLSSTFADEALGLTLSAGVAGGAIGFALA